MEAEGFQQSGDEIYAENVPVVRLFMDMLTQWRVGPGGVVGLDYNVLPMLFDVREIASDERGDLFDGLKIMESAALEKLRGND